MAERHESGKLSDTFSTSLAVSGLFGLVLTELLLRYTNDERVEKIRSYNSGLRRMPEHNSQRSLIYIPRGGAVKVQIFSKVKGFSIKMDDFRPRRDHPGGARIVVNGEEIIRFDTPGQETTIEGTGINIQYIRERPTDLLDL